MQITKILAAVMLVITMGLGVLLAQVVGERNVAQTKLESASETLDSQGKALEKIEDALDSSKKEVTNCLGSLELQRAAYALLSKQAADETKASVGRADTVLTSLPAQISKDREYRTLSQANAWIKELVQ